MGEIADYYACQQVGDEWDKQNLKKLKPALHKCKDGKIVDVRGVSNAHPKMEDDHLLNTIAYIKKRAKGGIKISYGGGECPDTFWYDEDWLFGEEAKKYLSYKIYKKEAQRRGLVK